MQDEVASEEVLPRSSCERENEKKALAFVRKKAMDLLARREHAVEEMRQKLHAFLQRKSQKEASFQQRETPQGFCLTEIEDCEEIVARVLEDLRAESLLSDERFTEAFVRYRKNNGYGPMRIQTELRERGVNEKIQAAWLEFSDPHWFEQVTQVRLKRFGAGLPGDYKERARQARFLQYRGFTTDQIKQALASENCD